MKKIAVIVAGGAGARMQSDHPKQFLPLLGTPILIHTIRAFESAFADIRLIVVLPSAHFEEGKKIVAAHLKSTIDFVEGGETRFHSVKNGLSLVKEESVVFVHDAVRCLLTPSLIVRCFEEASLQGSAVPVVPSKDSIRFVTPAGNQMLNREQVMLVQTPQVFLSSWILPAFDTEYETSFTDEAAVVEKTGKKINLIQGEVSNIKITEPVDLLIAEQWFAKENSSRV
ncbi:MAG: 2-C-methyl-D-erythritol 4-phosphate cytidylyltransferase [Chitinophagia bacterium]|nr:2-C-methyl-D-erythritol 4-phosphate cytidylyltransferase [Chitinophagia bacterium]